MYTGLGSKTLKDLIRKYNNLIIIGSFSKNIGLPALRIGFMISSKDMIKLMESFKLTIELPYHSIKIVSSFLKQKKDFEN